MTPCANCQHWRAGCTLPERDQLTRHHGAPGDDSGTVLGWRLLYGVPCAPADVDADALDTDGIECPGRAPWMQRL